LCRIGMGDDATTPTQGHAKEGRANDGPSEGGSVPVVMLISR
jgi:hypothetical protein